jgi:hypothetical protein
MTRPKRLFQLKRPRRRLGQTIGQVLSCPLCFSQRLSAVRWSPNSVRLECKTCGCRFTVDLERLPAAMTKLIDERGGQGSWDGLSHSPPFVLAKGFNRSDVEFVEDARKVYPGSRFGWVPVPKPEDGPPGSDPTTTDTEDE